MQTNIQRITLYAAVDVDGGGKVLLLKVIKQLSSEDKIIRKGKVSITELNYGLGADWPVELIEFIVSDPVSATLNLNAVYEIFQKLSNGIKKKLKRKRGEPIAPQIFLGPEVAASVVAIKLKEIGVEPDLELITTVELEKGDSFIHKEYIILLKPQNVGEAPTNSIYLAHIDWQGNIKHFSSF